MIISNPLPSCSRQAPPPRPRFTTVNGGYGLTGMRERLLLIREPPHRGIRRLPLDRDGAGVPVSRPSAAPLRIIIADDQASVREGLVLLLGMLPGIEVICAAADGQQALDLVAEHHPDVILLDLHMPGIDGIQATRTLTAEHPEVAIVILTTYADDTSVLSALRAGARSYLTKDADRVDIARALHSARGYLHGPRSLQATWSPPPRKRHLYTRAKRVTTCPTDSPPGRLRSWP